MVNMSFCSDVIVYIVPRNYCIIYGLILIKGSEFHSMNIFNI